MNTKPKIFISYTQYSSTKKEIAVLFSDIRGFTKLSEELEPEHLVDIINVYSLVCCWMVYHRKTQFLLISQHVKYSWSS